MIRQHYTGKPTLMLLILTPSFLTYMSKESKTLLQRAFLYKNAGSAHNIFIYYPCSALAFFSRFLMYK